VAGDEVARWWQVIPAAAPIPGRGVGHSSRERGGLLLTKVSSELAKVSRELMKVSSELSKVSSGLTKVSSELRR
jgi:hypothetical protein